MMDDGLWMMYYIGVGELLVAVLFTGKLLNEPKNQTNKIANTECIIYLLVNYQMYPKSTH